MSETAKDNLSEVLDHIRGSKGFEISYVSNGNEYRLPMRDILKEKVEIPADVAACICMWLETGGEIEEICGYNAYEIPKYIDETYDHYVEVARALLRILAQECIDSDIAKEIYNAISDESDDLSRKSETIKSLRAIFESPRLLKKEIIQYTDIIPLMDGWNYTANRHKRVVDNYDFSSIVTPEIQLLVDDLGAELSDPRDLRDNVMQSIRRAAGILDTPHIGLVYENGHSMTAYTKGEEKFDKDFIGRMHYLKSSLKEKKEMIRFLKKVIFTQVCSMRADNISAGHNNAGRDGRGVGSFIKVVYDNLTEDQDFSDSDFRVSYRDLRTIETQEVAKTQYIADRIKDAIRHFSFRNRVSLGDIFDKDRGVEI